MSVGERLKSERQVLGLSQTEFAESCGSTKRMQIYFEGDSNLPGGAYLIAAAALGVDVKYVLTGERGMQRVTVPIDGPLLMLCLEGVEEGLRQTGRRMAVAGRAALVAKLYGLYAGHAMPSQAAILQLVKKAA